MDIALQGFLLPRHTGPNLFVEGGDKWRSVKKDENLFEVTLESLQDGSTEPLRVWLVNATKNEETFHPGQPVIVERKSRYWPCIYYIEDPEQRKQFDLFNLIYVRLCPNVKTSPRRSNLEFTCENNSVEVSHRKDKERTGRFNLFHWHLDFHYEFEINGSNPIGRDELSNYVYLEEKEDVLELTIDETLEEARVLEDPSTEMDIELEGFELTKKGETKLFCGGSDKWRCEKQGATSYKVTLKSLGDGSSGPLQVWFIGATTNEVTFHPGQPVVIEASMLYAPYAYYIKDPAKRDQFDRYHLIHLKLYSDVKASPMGSNLEFSSKDNWIYVSDKANKERQGRIKVLYFRLKASYELAVNRKHCLGPCKIGGEMYLEEK